MKRALRWLLPAAAVPVLALLAYGFTVNHRDIPSPLVNRPAAKFTLTSYAGEPMSLEAQRGKVVVLNFWASWCYPACYEEAPVLERGWRAYKDRGVVVLGVDIQDKAEAGKKFIDTFTLTFPNASIRPGGCRWTTACMACPRRSSSMPGATSERSTWAP